MIRHLATVSARLEAAAGAEPDARWLQLAVLVHEQPADSAATVLARAGFADVKDRIVAVLRGFGALWKIRDAAERRAFIRDCGDGLAPLLLFELAHEGRATEAMIETARAGGLEATLRSWASRLAAVK